MATSLAARPLRSVPADLRAALDWSARLALLALMTWIGSATGHPYGRVVDLPLADLSVANPALDLARAFEIALVFDQVPEGVVTLRCLRLGPADSPRWRRAPPVSVPVSCRHGRALAGGVHVP